jgi:hypothetical protein
MIRDVLEATGPGPLTGLEALAAALAGQAERYRLAALLSLFWPRERRTFTTPSGRVVVVEGRGDDPDDGPALELLDAALALEAAAGPGGRGG